MDIFLGYAGVAVAFFIMMFVLLMIFIKAPNVSWKKKFILIPFVLWYSVALYYVPSNFMGWPTERWVIENEVIVISYQIDEENAFYFWVIDYNIKNVRKMYDARTAFMPYIDDTPRAYKVVYDSDTHKALIEARKKLNELGRGGMTMRMDNLQGMTKFDGNKPMFKIFDPAEVLKKTTDDQ